MMTAVEIPEHATAVFPDSFAAPGPSVDFLDSVPGFPEYELVQLDQDISLMRLIVFLDVKKCLLEHFSTDLHTIGA